MWKDVQIWSWMKSWRIIKISKRENKNLSGGNWQKREEDSIAIGTSNDSIVEFLKGMKENGKKKQTSRPTPQPHLSRMRATSQKLFEERNIFQWLQISHWDFQSPFQRLPFVFGQKPQSSIKNRNNEINIFKQSNQGHRGNLLQVSFPSQKIEEEAQPNILTLN